MNQRLFIAGGVVLLHIAALWALQTGLLRRAVEIVVPAQVLSEITPPPPPPPAPRPEPPKPAPPTRTPPPQPAAAPAPTLQPTPEAVAPAPSAPAPLPVQVPQAPPVVAAPAAAPAPAPPPPRVELPSSSAAYLNNPAPAYPALSRRLGEQGKVVLRVLIGADGSAQKAEIQTSSGHERLDRAALATVLQWRFVPGKRGGVPETMWFNVPISFVLE